MARRKFDPKVEALRKRGCLHPHPEKVTEEVFLSSEFFDSRDLLQVKYEMLRRVRTDGQTVSGTVMRFGLSRQSYYQALAAYEEGGLAALLPERPGPRRAHKLTAEVVAFLRKALEKEPKLNAVALAGLVRERFDMSVHPRSVERALFRQEKKRQR
jgi:transposase